MPRPIIKQTIVAGATSEKVLVLSVEVEGIIHDQKEMDFVIEEFNKIRNKMRTDAGVK